MTVAEVPLGTATLDRYRALLGDERVDRLAAAAAELTGWLAGRRVSNVNSTALGGGVAEMLHRLVPLARGLGVPVGWQVIGGPPEFFAVTKRLCDRLYGVAGDGGALGAPERAVYQAAAGRQLAGLLEVVRRGDVVVLHDPQTLGLAPGLAAAGCLVVWRCHVGIDRQNQHSEPAWEFLRPYLTAVRGAVFTLREHAPDWLVERVPLREVPPSLDPFSPKSRDMTPDETRSVLTEAGLFADGSDPSRLVTLTQDRPLTPERPVVTQISRWDRLKDMPGVLTAFADHVLADGDASGADLLLAGPDVRGVADDPAAAGAFAECLERWRALPGERRRRVHLAMLSMADPDANALTVNALQRHAAVVTQKSLAEGFGLTVTEAMWKAAPVVASTVGGIRRQITDGVEGLLVDPDDLPGFGRAVAALLADRERALGLGAAARRRVDRDFLVDRHLLDWAAVLPAADAGAPAAAG